MGVAGGFDRAKVIDEICERVSEGETLRSVCRDEHIPSWRTVYDWLDADPDFASRFARARDLGETAIGAGCMDIADEVPPTNANGGIDAGYVQHQKLRIWTRLELLKRWNPKKWGDRVQQDVTVTQNLTDEQLNAKIAELSAATDGDA